MGFRVIIILLFTFFTASIFAQGVEEQINSIRSKYKQTEASLSKCFLLEESGWVDEDDYSGFTPNIIAYVDTVKNEIIKIEESGDADWYQEKMTYYISNGELYFVFTEINSGSEMYSAEELGITEEELWERGGEAKTVEYSETRIYIHDGKVIRELQKVKIFNANEGDPNLKEVKNEEQFIEDDNYEDIFNHFEKLLLHLKIKLNNTPR